MVIFNSYVKLPEGTLFFSKPKSEKTVAPLRNLHLEVCFSWAYNFVRPRPLAL